MTDLVKGNVFIVAAPSGGGKTSLVRELIASLSDIELSVSHTTRLPRPGERDGQDYFFVSEKEFMEMIDDSAFVEQALVFNHYYGTSLSQINKRLDAGVDVVLDIDWQGALQIRHLYPDAVSIFIVPPSLAILKKRLQDRRQDDELIISQRMQQAQDEMSHYSEFDFLLVNDDFSKASAELQAIVLSNRLTLRRQSRKIGNLLSLLLASK